MYRLRGLPLRVNRRTDGADLLCASAFSPSPSARSRLHTFFLGLFFTAGFYFLPSRFSHTGRFRPSGVAPVESLRVFLSHPPPPCRAQARALVSSFRVQLSSASRVSRSGSASVVQPRTLALHLCKKPAPRSHLGASQFRHSCHRAAESYSTTPYRDAPHASSSLSFERDGRGAFASTIHV